MREKLIPIGVQGASGVEFQPGRVNVFFSTQSRFHDALKKLSSYWEPSERNLDMGLVYVPCQNLGAVLNHEA